MPSIYAEIRPKSEENCIVLFCVFRYNFIGNELEIYQKLQ